MFAVGINGLIVVQNQNKGVILLVDKHLIEGTDRISNTDLVLILEEELILAHTVQQDHLS